MKAEAILNQQAMLSSYGGLPCAGPHTPHPQLNSLLFIEIPIIGFYH